ncbi:MAG: alpha/beta hydrolase [Streptosporangiaceae bacterium]
MSTALINGVTVSYSDTGGDGAPVVFSHGYLMDATMFDRQVAALAPEYRVITWDQRGFGGSRATGEFSFWDSAADLLGLLDHLGVERAVLAGMSQGGFAGLRAALLAPDRVRGLVLIDSQAGQEDPAVAPAYEQLDQIWQEQGPAPVQDTVAAIILGPPGGPVDYAPWFAKWAAVDRAELHLAFRCLMDRDDVTGRLGEIRCPALIVHGTADPAIPVAKAEIVQAGLAGPAELVLIDGGSHAANLSHPDQVNVALLEFLRSLP